MSLHTNASLRTNTVADIFDAPIPRGLRELTVGMSWDDLVSAYGHRAGPIRLGNWDCADNRAASRLGPQPRRYRATIGIGDRIATATAVASGPVAALTAMLFEHGMPIEILRFHQLRSGQRIATFVQGSDGVRTEWAMGVAKDATESALRAVIACANRL